jgi:hypothetical protein
LQGHADAAEMMDAGEAVGRFPRRLQRRHHHARQDPYDRDHDQQFDQRKSSTQRGFHGSAPREVKDEG